MTDVKYTTKLSLPHTELIVGRSGSGKTHYLIHQLESILKNNLSVLKIYIICPTIDDNKAYRTWKLPGSLSKKVHYIGCDQDSVNEELREIIGKCKTPGNKGSEDIVKNIIVLDDCAQGNDVKGRTSPLVSLAFNARHIGVGVIVVTQQLTSISKPYRDNLSRVVTFHMQSKQSNNLMFDEFLGSASDIERKQIQHTLKTNRYSYLVVNLGFPHTYDIIIS